jgi:hypothetical protein
MSNHLYRAGYWNGTYVTSSGRVIYGEVIAVFDDGCYRIERQGSPGGHF